MTAQSSRLGAKSFWQDVFVQWRIIVYSATVASASIHMGYTMGISNGVTVLKPFRATFGILHGTAYIVPSLWLSLWNLLGPSGGMLGSLTGAQFQDCLSRRLTLTLAGIFAVVGVGFLYSSDTYYHAEARRGSFLAGKVLQDFANGIITTQAMTYISEIASDELSGATLALPGVFQAIGHLVAAAVLMTRADIIETAAYKLPIALGWIFGGAIITISHLVPESPVHLVRRNEPVAAAAALRRLVPVIISAEEEILRIQSRVDCEQSVRGRESWIHCFNGRNRRATGLIAFCSCLPAVIGVPLWTTKGYFLQLLGLSPRESLIVVLISVCVSCIGHAVGFWAIGTAQRRKLLVASLSLVTVLYTGMGLTGSWPGKAASWAPAVLMVAAIFCSSATILPIAVAVAAESSCYQLRSKSLAIYGVISHLATVIIATVVPYMYNPDAGNLGAKTAFIFAGLSCLGGIAVWLIGSHIEERTVMHEASVSTPVVTTRKWEIVKKDMARETKSQETTRESLHQRSVPMSHS